MRFRDEEGGGGWGGDDPGNVTGKYILKDRVPVECPHLLCWARWYEVDANRMVAFSRVGRFHVSTIFLGLANGGWILARLEDRPVSRLPALFEAVLFEDSGEGRDGRIALERDEAFTWGGAEAAHARLVSRAHRETFPERYG